MRSQNSPWTMGVIVLLMLGLGACARSKVSQPDAAGTPTSTQSVSAQSVAATATPSGQHTQAIIQCLGQLINAGYQIYGLTQAQQWQSIAPQIDQVKQRMEDLEAQSNLQPQTLEGLRTQLTVLSQAAAAQDTQATMRSANEIIFDGAQLLAQDNPLVPLTAMQLEYYARDLAITVMTKDNSALRDQARKRTIRDIQKTWEQIKTQPSHSDPEVIQTIDHAVQQLNQVDASEKDRDLAETIIVNTHKLIQ